MCKLLESILMSDNLNRAYLQVYRNKGSQGIDGMSVDMLKDQRLVQYYQIFI
jgi:hypothetical protein